MAEHGSQPGDGLSPNGGPNSNSNGRDDSGRAPLPGSSNSSNSGSSHLVPSVKGSAANGTNGTQPSGSSNGSANGGGNGENGSVLSVDDPRTRALLEQLLQTITMDGVGSSEKERPRPSLVSEIWMALRRRWKPMLVVFALALAAISWKLRPVGTQFVATATMQLPKSSDGGSPDLLGISGQRNAAGSTLDTQIAIIKSAPFVNWVKHKAQLALEDQARHGRLPAPQRDAAIGAIKDATFEAQAPVSPELVNVTATSDNPVTSVTLANTSIDMYGERLIHRGNLSQNVDKDFVRNRRDEKLKELNRAKVDLQKFKEANNVFDIQEALTRNNAAIETLTQNERAARIEEQAGKDATSISGDAITQGLQQRAAETGLNYDAVTRLFFPNSPEGLEAKSKLDAAQKLYNQRVDRLVDQNKQRAQDAVTAIKEARQRADKLPLIEYQMSRLQDQVAQAGTTYGQLSTRYTQLALSSAAQPATSDPIQRADMLSIMPVSRTWSRAILTGLLCAFVLASLCALLLEQLDHSLHSVSDLEPLLPAGVLGTMPLLRGRSERRLAQMTGAQPMAPRVLEACRIVRSNLSFATMDSPAQTILITSAAPGEGKSLSALNLATVTAFDGRRVLLLDCDLRRPSQHSLNGLPLEPGFTNLLAGEASVEEAIQSTKVNNLWVMTAGTLPLNPPELLGSPEARRLLHEFKDRFDVIVIDSPPVLALTDAQVLCSQVDGVVMIVAAESTSKEEVQRAQAMLRHAGGRLLGAVFNKVRRGDATPGYGTYAAYAAYGPNTLGRDRALSESVGTLGKQ